MSTNRQATGSMPVALIRHLVNIKYRKWECGYNSFYWSKNQTVLMPREGTKNKKIRVSKNHYNMTPRKGHEEKKKKNNNAI